MSHSVAAYIQGVLRKERERQHVSHRTYSEGDQLSLNSADTGKFGSPSENSLEVDESPCTVYSAAHSERGDRLLGPAVNYEPREFELVID